MFTFGQEERLCGFWEITSVSMGTESMTPIARWIKLKEDHSYTSGNGWLQNAAGSWKLDKETHILTSIDSLGISEDFAGFKVSFEGKNMLWEREENGMTVQVTLKPITKKPMAPADYLVGLWKLHEADAEDYTRIFMRWDRIYNEYVNNEKKSSGYWHINAHRPEVTFLPHQEDKMPESWRVNANKTELILTGISDSNRGKQLHFSRLHAF
ncbi:hypothetical protein [Gaetbulibacter aestuarii]|uniref:Lipocalin-like domain-containing protein n=1 Tax=Gaetbulibacter aestuarii TaxID=1502358 RepID=A0ABW7MXQ1_9FLAO